ncbi:hypothetical protein L5876_05830 [Hyphobacterium sp. SN044]|uniref:hypothetical protein n=1 Tax=Hyphobacterium sp. SN044 TaxID=2912575 RepID=UPI001F201F95|nr:hypothetical protein [Hyphobacterium sp. SN044]MCF8879330.1 hypothetical protein [Hyphobacterium sp. SN044]
MRYAILICAFSFIAASEASARSQDADGWTYLECNWTRTAYQDVDGERSTADELSGRVILAFNERAVHFFMLDNRQWSPDLCSPRTADDTARCLIEATGVRAEWTTQDWAESRYLTEIDLASMRYSHAWDYADSAAFSGGMRWAGPCTPTTDPTPDE